MGSSDQQELFPEPTHAQDVDTQAWAESVASAGDRRGPIEDRPPSDAAVDQGWGHVERTTTVPEENLGSVALSGGAIDADEPVYFGPSKDPRQNKFNLDQVRRIRGE